MQINSLSNVAPLYNVQNVNDVSQPQTFEKSSTINTADSFAMGSANFSASPSYGEPFSPSSQGSRDALLALDEVFAYYGVATENSASNGDNRATEVVSKQMEPQNIGGFYLADGTCVADVQGEHGSASSSPALADFADYKYIDPKEATANYENNVKDKINVFERAAIKAYCTFAYRMMNGYLLGTKGSPTGTIKMATKCMTKALDRFDVPAGSILYRTSNINELRNYVPADKFADYEKYEKAGKTKALASILDNRLTGTQTTRKSFLSTTIDPNFDFEDKPKVATKLYVGDNVKGIYVASDLSRFPGEQEYLLAPDTKVTVLGVDYNPKNDGMVLHVMLGDKPENSPVGGKA